MQNLSAFFENYIVTVTRELAPFGAFS